VGVAQLLLRISDEFAVFAVSLLSKFSTHRAITARRHDDDSCFSRIKMYITETAMHGISFVLTLVFQQRKYSPIFILCSGTLVLGLVLYE